MTNKSSQYGIVLLAMVMGALIGFASAAVMATQRIDPHQSPAYKRGELPTGVPVLVYWMEDDGTITAASALRTDYAGVLQFSTTGHAVPLQPLEGWFAWSELKPMAMEAIR